MYTVTIEGVSQEIEAGCPAEAAEIAVEILDKSPLCDVAVLVDGVTYIVECHTSYEAYEAQG